MMKDLLRHARAEGSLDMLLAELSADHGDGFELISEKETVVSGTDDSKNVSGSPFSYEKNLPAGMRDLEHWGKTILQVGKYEKAGLCYDQFPPVTARSISVTLHGCWPRSIAWTSPSRSKISSAICMSRAFPSRLRSCALMIAQRVAR